MRVPRSPKSPRPSVTVIRTKKSPNEIADDLLSVRSHNSILVFPPTRSRSLQDKSPSIAGSQLPAKPGHAHGVRDAETRPVARSQSTPQNRSTSPTGSFLPLWESILPKLEVPKEKAAERTESGILSYWTPSSKESRNPEHSGRAAHEMKHDENRLPEVKKESEKSRALGGKPEQPVKDVKDSVPSISDSTDYTSEHNPVDTSGCMGQMFSRVNQVPSDIKEVGTSSDDEENNPNSRKEANTDDGENNPNSRKGANQRKETETITTPETTTQGVKLSKKPSRFVLFRRADKTNTTNTISNNDTKLHGPPTATTKFRAKLNPFGMIRRKNKSRIEKSKEEEIKEEYHPRIEQIRSHGTSRGDEASTDDSVTGHTRCDDCMNLCTDTLEEYFFPNKKNRV